jgi:hypothetical protein
VARDFVDYMDIDRDSIGKVCEPVPLERLLIEQDIISLNSKVSCAAQQYEQHTKDIENVRDSKITYQKREEKVFMENQRLAAVETQILVTQMLSLLLTPKTFYLL